MTKGFRIRQLRESLNLPQIDVANAIGVSKQTLYKYEHDIVSNIPSDKIEELAHVLNTTPEYLMGWTDEVGNDTTMGMLVKSYQKKAALDKLDKYEVSEIELATHLYDLYQQAPPEIQVAVETLLKSQLRDS